MTASLGLSGRATSGRTSTRQAARPNYAGVADMCRHLASLDERSEQYRRQREQIIELCLPLANNIARRFNNRGEPLDDLVQVARVGLLQALNRFDPENGAEFLAFAVPTMMGEVRRHFRDRGWAMKVPRRLKEIGLELNRSRDELSQTLRRAPTAGEIAAHLGIDYEEVVQAQIAFSCYSTMSSDAPTGSDDGDGRRTVATSFGDLDSRYDKVLEIESVRPVLAALPERQRLVLNLRFFENMTQTQIAQHLGISQMHVSRLLARSLAAVREGVVPAEHV